MDRIGQQITEVEVRGEVLKEALENGELEWDNETVQFFIPVVLHFTNFDWLRLIAENNLVKEDEIVVKNFLDMVQSLMEINEIQLEKAVEDKIKILLKMMGDD